jgi:hypothetical protein
VRVGDKRFPLTGMGEFEMMRLHLSICSMYTFKPLTLRHTCTGAPTSDWGGCRMFCSRSAEQRSYPECSEVRFLMGVLYTAAYILFAPVYANFNQ